MRRVTLKRPFTGGIVTDVPAYDLAPNLSPYAQDGYSPSGVFRMRAGWAYDGTTADVADYLWGVYRNTFALADVTRTITTDDDGEAFIHNPSSAGTALFTRGVPYLPRTVYRDELLFCAQDGLQPLIRYSGANTGTTLPLSYTGTITLAEGEATTGGTLSITSPGAGAYCALYRTTAAYNVSMWHRILESSSSSVTLENIRAGAGGGGITAGGSTVFLGYGYAWPAVSVYSAGTVTFNGTSTLTGYGTKWDSFSFVQDIDDGGDAVVVIPPTGNSSVFTYVTNTGHTNMSVTGGPGSSITDKSIYHVTRRCNFKDVASHKESLWGAGNAFYPNRVYVGPPAWDLAGPPGFPTPYDPLTSITSPNANDFFMNYSDVPNPNDGDHIVAILPSSGPLLVLKRRAVYGIYGDYAERTINLVQDGIGCIDIRSAQSFDEGQFWAGETGIFWYRNGQVVDLTAGRINREWRELTRDFDYGLNDYCTIGLSQGHLIVHITTNAGGTRRTYLCDLSDGSWQSRISNFFPRYMNTSRQPGEPEKLLAVANVQQGRVIDFAPAINGEGIAKDGDGNGPHLYAWTPEGIDGTAIDDDTRLLDLAISANAYDAGADGATSANVYIVTQDALGDEATSETYLSDINSDSVDRIDRHYYRRVNKRGRRHQVRIDVDTIGTNTAATKFEVHEIDASFRDTRSRT